MAPYFSATWILVSAAHGGAVAECGPYKEFLQLGLSAALLPTMYAIWCNSSGLREQGKVEVTGMMLKGEKACSESWGWEWCWHEGYSGVMVLESRGTILGCCFCLLFLTRMEELGQTPGRHCRQEGRAELQHSRSGNGVWFRQANEGGTSAEPWYWSCQWLTSSILSLSCR